MPATQAEPDTIEVALEAERAFAWLAGIPDAGLYGVMAAAAALKAIAPPVPADTTILICALLVGQGTGSLWLAAIVTVTAALLGTLAAYEGSRALGPGFVRLPVIRTFLRPSVLAAVHRVHARFGPAALFIGRFMPGIRHAIPIFAGLTGLGRRSALLPMFAATAIWYGALVGFGGVAGQRFDRALREGELPIGAIALVILALAAIYLLGLLTRHFLRHRREGDTS